MAIFWQKMAIFGILHTTFPPPPPPATTRAKLLRLSVSLITGGETDFLQLHLRFRVTAEQSTKTSAFSLFLISKYPRSLYLLFYSSFISSHLDSVSTRWDTGRIYNPDERKCHCLLFFHSCSLPFFRLSSFSRYYLS